MAHNKHSRVIFIDVAFQSVVFNRAAELSFIPQQWMCLLWGHCGAVPDGSLAPVCCLDFRSLENVQSSVALHAPVTLQTVSSSHQPCYRPIAVILWLHGYCSR
ncbi:unnamed protein product [Leuciscus chuanchicus]